MQVEVNVGVMYEEVVGFGVVTGVRGDVQVMIHLYICSGMVFFSGLCKGKVWGLLRLCIFVGVVKEMKESQGEYGFLFVCKRRLNIFRNMGSCHGCARHRSRSCFEGMGSCGVVREEVTAILRLPSSSRVVSPRVVIRSVITTFTGKQF